MFFGTNCYTLFLCVGVVTPVALFFYKGICFCSQIGNHPLEASFVLFRFFFGWGGGGGGACSHNGNHPQEDLAKFGSKGSKFSF
jgi:hypothetical protein